MGQIQIEAGRILSRGHTSSAWKPGRWRADMTRVCTPRREAGLGCPTMPRRTAVTPLRMPLAQHRYNMRSLTLQCLPARRMVAGQCTADTRSRLLTIRLLMGGAMGAAATHHVDAGVLPCTICHTWTARRLDRHARKFTGCEKRIAVSHLRLNQLLSDPIPSFRVNPPLDRPTVLARFQVFSLMHVLCRCAGGHPFC